MATTYPIVQERPLGAAQKRRMLGLGKRVRDEDELLKPSAHEVLVYRVHGQYIVDNFRRGAGHEQVVDASHVSVVDMTRDAPVVVQLEVPSAEASPFTVQVTFVCTVTDPVVVVRSGLGDAQTVLSSYLRSHHRIFELGQDFRIDQINEVRHNVNAQIQAYTMVNPPVESGMLIRWAGVEVLTPTELVEFEKKRRQQRQENTLVSERLGLDHSLNRDREDNTYELNELRQRHTQNLDDANQLHDHERDYRQQQQEHLLRTDAQRNDQLLAAERNEFQRDELTKFIELVGTDPAKAYHLAYAAGQRSPMELASDLREQEDRAHAREDAARQRDREDLLQLRRDEREDKLRQLELDREERHLVREDKRIQAKAVREDHLQERRWQRDDRLLLEEATREDQRQRMQANLEVVSRLIQQGTFDNSAINVEKFDQFVNGILENTQDSQIESKASKELPETAEPARDVEVREEDAG